MMEQAKTRHSHSNIVFITRFDNIIITDRAACLGNVIDAAAVSSFYVIAKGEEGITAKSYAVQLSNPSLLFFFRKGFWFFRK